MLDADLVEAAVGVAEPVVSVRDPADGAQAFWSFAVTRPEVFACRRRAA